MADIPEDFEKIKRNVQKMLSMNAPDEDVMEYLTSERLSPDEFKLVATGGAKLGDVRMTQKSRGEIAKTLSAGQTIPEEDIGRGSILPFSKVMPTGEVYFDPDAGLLGALKRAAMLPGDVAMGKLDPESGEGARRMAEFAMAGTPTGAAARVGETTLPAGFRALRLGQPKTPTAQELKEAGKAAQTQARSLGVDYSPEAVKSLGDDITRTLEADGFFPETAGKTFSLLSRLKEPPAEAGATTVVSLDNVVTLRRSLQKAAGDFTNPSEQAAASRAIELLDRFVVEPPPQSVVAGPSAAASALMDESRGNFAANFRSNKISGIIEQAERDAAAAGSGNNLDNRTRQIVNSFLKNDKANRGFSKEEIALLDDIVRGKRGTNIARWIGNFFGGGGGLGSYIPSAVGGAAGSVIAGPPGAALGAALPPAIGATFRGIASKSTQSGVRSIDEITRQRSPLFNKRAQEVLPIVGLSSDARSLIERLLLMQVAEETGQ
jgi:hypothetical protein